VWRGLQRTDTPGDTPTGTQIESPDGTPVTTDENTPTPEPETSVPGTPEPGSPETFYTVEDQQLWEVVQGTVEGLTVEDGILSAAEKSEDGSFETFTFVGDQPRDLRLWVHETPLWDT